MARPKLYNNTPCVNDCGDMAVIRGQCRTCDSYERRTGKKRPQDLIIRHNRRQFENGVSHKVMGRHPSPENVTTVYRYYDSDNCLLYVGITKNARSRQSGHVSTAAWWPRVAFALYEHFPTRVQALRREAELIRKELPPFNSQGKKPIPEEVVTKHRNLEAASRRLFGEPLSRVSTWIENGTLTTADPRVVELLTYVDRRLLSGVTSGHGSEYVSLPPADPPRGRR